MIYIMITNISEHHSGLSCGELTMTMTMTMTVTYLYSFDMSSECRSVQRCPTKLTHRVRVCTLID